MSTKDNIENLFASEDLQTPDEAQSNTELPKIDAGVEKRQFTRVDIGEKKVGVRFNNQLQFARQYIENISLGGLFVKTAEKYEMGQIVSIEFKIPHPDKAYEEISFLLKAAVCRITKDGVGLEFTNLTQENRLFLENYVRSVLPKGSEVRAKPKQAIVDRIDQLRQHKLETKLRRRKILIRTLIVTGLIFINLTLLQETLKTSDTEVSYTTQTIKVNDQEIHLNKIRSIVQKADGNLWIQHSDGEVLIKNPSSLPAHLRHQAHIVESIAPAKEKRRSKNASNFVNTRP